MKQIRISEEQWSYFQLLFEGIELDAIRLRQDLEKYLYLLLSANEKTNLTSISDPDIGVWKHLYDSLLITLCEPMGTVLDWGTGGGTPGIPLALFRRARGIHKDSVDFLDSIKKKANLVNEFLLELQISSSHVFAERGEKILNSRSYNTVVMRAVAPPERAIPWMTKRAEQYLFMTGPKQVLEWKEHTTQVAARGFYLKKELIRELPFAHGTRHILCFRQA